MTDYYSEIKDRIIDFDEDVCSLAIWNKHADEYLCAKHSEGFYIFLKGDKIEVADEYLKQNPDSVNEELKSDFHQRRINCTIDLIEEISKDNSKLLDIGCGMGHPTAIYKKRFPTMKIYGLDQSITGIRYAHKAFKDIDFIVADAYTPPFADDFFDIIVLNNIWEHVPDPLKLLNVIDRILKPRGTIIISTPSRYRYGNLIKSIFGKKITFLNPLHVTEFTVGQVKEQLKFGGFQAEKIYSPKIKEGKLIHNFLKSLISFYLKIIKSDHILEQTVFYSATKLK